ncbi:outer membrane protein with beta-barrel domain [Arcticibacter tournemirensis]|uniref:PorT family protein n=1 Tax=Arcticibacter tournemirensis TaxID=699437 RepID=A0A5M9HJC0_9SPHI|nr:porin family protein [Arcticibacter tournemirensis]KAA8485531.1 PorT family protein [Arcticibacter tournemirensis]TQM48758.1 outer membrane protein with beta-barrel domain [Arcticibacter tournemirensis]
MKKIILLSCLCVAMSFASFAQLPSFNLGVKAGLNLATLKSDNFFGEENRLGYQFGVWARLGGAGFYVQPEAYLAGKGGKFDLSQDNGVNAEGKVRFTTLDVPVLIGNKIGFDKLNVRFMAGPVVSFILDDSFKSNFQNVTDVNDYKNQTWGAQIGAGVDIGSLAVDLRYEAGLSNVSKSGQYDQKQNLWHLSLGYKLF